MHELTEAPATGLTRVTATGRLARARRAEEAVRRQAEGAAVWATPDALPWSAWLERLWSEASLTADLPLLLDPAQERCLWERVVADSGLAPPLGVAGLAREAQRAWQLAQGWRLPVGGAQGGATAEQQAFCAWARAFEAHCAQGGWLDAARLPAALVGVLDGLTLPRTLALEGFDQWSPAERALLERLAAAGVQLREEAEPAACDPGRRVVAADGEAERRAMAAWVRSRLEAGARSVMVVAPRLGQQREAICRALDEELVPGAVGSPESARPYDISLGLPLTDYPLVDDALRLLALEAGRAPWEDWSRVLRSPFLLGARREAEARARLDARLRRRGHWLWSARAVLEAARREGCPQLAEVLGRLLERLRGRTGRARPGAWVGHWCALLGTLGWPGEEPLSSPEFQVLEAWRGLLDRVAGLDGVLPAMPASEALALLRRQAAERVFQPESPPAPVQVVGLLEAAGLRAEACWLLDATDEVLPSPTRPSPLLPLPLQRLHRLPQASALQEFALASRRLGRLRADHPLLVVSHPACEGDRVLRASPLVAAWPPEDAVGPALPRLAQAWLGRARLETLEDVRGAPLELDGPVHGGARIFSEQSACPFRAYARLRLEASTPEEPAPGLDAAARGTLAHAALARLWSELGAHAHLLALAPEALAQVVREAALAGLAAPEGRLLHDGPEESVELEQARLERLLAAWLEVERARPPFEVLEREVKREVRFAELLLRLQLDRVDRLPDGSRVLVDYKTGAVSGTKGWFGERPREPQLPLYAVTAEQAAVPAAVTYACLKPGALGYKGLTGGAEVASGVAALREGGPDWSQTLASWRGVLESLARAYAAGQARVDPADASACKRCDLHALCRIHEHAGPPRAPEGEEQDEEGEDGL